MQNPTQSTPALPSLLHYLPGLALSAALGLFAIWLAQSPVFTERGVSALTLALVFGLLVGNTVYPAAACHTGVGFAKQRLLRAGIVLYGLRLTFQDIGQLGWSGVALDALVLGSTFVLALWLGRKFLGLDARTTVLIGAGSSICGAAAVLATAPVVKGRAQDVAVAVSTVVVFGTIATFVYPALFHWNSVQAWFDLTPAQFGLYIGATVHEVAQVVAAGEAIAPEAADMAVIAKMVRVMMLAPFLLLLSAWWARKDVAARGEDSPSVISLPWFALGFIAVAGVNSLDILPAPLVQIGVQLDNLLLAVAMAALGLSTHISAVRAAGTRPLLLALMLFGWLLGAGLLLNLLLSAV